MLSIRELVKEYRAPPWRSAEARVRALDGVSLRVLPGEAVGLAGPNGAGKSTLLRILLGYLRPTSGEVAIDGAPPRHYVEQHGVGYVPESVALPPGWTVRGGLEAFAGLSPGADPRERADAALRSLGLEELAGRRLGTLSKGNLQRVALAQALVADRRMLVLDEPLNGLDPLWVARLRVLIQEWRAADPARVLLLVSHNLAEMERTVDRVAVLDRGRVRTVIDARDPREGGASLEQRFLESLGSTTEAAP